MKRSDELLSAPQIEMLRSRCSRNLFLAGQGAGKTHEMAFQAALFITRVPNVLGLLGANTYGQLTDATLLRIFQVWREYFGWEEFSKHNPSGVYVIDKAPPPHFMDHGYTFKNNHNKIFFFNGQVTQTVSMDNYKALDGREIGWALLDETKDTKEEAVNEVITGRLRQPGIYLDDYAPVDEFPYTSDSTAGPQQNPLFVYTSPTKEQWLTEYFMLEDQRDAVLSKLYDPEDYYAAQIGHRKVVICSTFHNQNNLPPGYISDRMSEFTKDRIDMLIYGSPYGKSGSEYYSNFKRDKHVDFCQVDEHAPLHLTFDFNVNPYMTGQVWQIDDTQGRVQARCIREYALTNPRNTIEHVCKAFEADFEEILLRQGMYFYGDASGKNSLPLKDVKDYYKIVERELFQFLHNRSRRLLKQNPRHRTIGMNTIGRRDFMNDLLAGKHPVDIVIDPSCKKTIMDFEFVKENVNGAKLKEKAEINGIKCEKYGHMSDAADGILCYLFGDYSKEKRS